MTSEYPAEPEPEPAPTPPGPAVADGKADGVYSDDEAALIAERLAALGYIE